MEVKNEVTKYEEQEPNHLIALALEKQADPETLAKLMALQERWEANQARKAFVLAMTSFKQEAPAVLIKGDTVDFQTAKGRTKYNYANLGSIVQEITAMLGKYELSANWETAQSDKGDITVTCHITHSAGHRESVTLRGPADESGNKNKIQAVGSTVTYLQRYTLLAALGLATGEDDDGKGRDKPVNNQLHNPKTSPVKPQGAPQQHNEGGAYVEGMEVKKGKKKDGSEWQLFILTIAGEKYSTFSASFAKIATDAHKAGLPVVFEFEQAEKGKNLKSIEIAQAPLPEGTLCNSCQLSLSCEHPTPEGDSVCLDYVPKEPEEKTQTEAF